MTGAEARAWVAAADVPRETSNLLDRFACLVVEESQRQNLVASSTLDQLWARHFVDSCQLLPLAPAGGWLDIGSGAGFPGLVVALAGRDAVTLVEPRALRAAFLSAAVRELGVADRVTIMPARLAGPIADQPHAVISARAVASLTKLLEMGQPAADRTTIWLLPKGRSAARELAEARDSWHGEFALVPSITDPDAAIVVATDVRPRKRR